MANDKFEKELWSAGNKYIAACDETGMGSLAGDVYVAMVVFPQDFDFTLIKGTNDSKQLTPEKRESLYDKIKQYALSYAIETASVAEIDEHNIYWARFIAARRALEKLTVKPDFILIDGNAEIPEITIPQKAIVKGDAKSLSIAAASILAKVERDRYIVELSDKVHEDYGWKSNKAYYTATHVQAIKKHGKTQYHREKYVSKFIGEKL